LEYWFFKAIIIVDTAAKWIPCIMTMLTLVDGARNHHQDLQLRQDIKILGGHLLY
jgi:hypothetical protein